MGFSSLRLAFFMLALAGGLLLFTIIPVITVYEHSVASDKVHRTFEAQPEDSDGQEYSQAALAAIERSGYGIDKSCWEHSPGYDTQSRYAILTRIAGNSERNLQDLAHQHGRHLKSRLNFTQQNNIHFFVNCHIVTNESLSWYPVGWNSTGSHRTPFQNEIYHLKWRFLLAYLVRHRHVEWVLLTDLDVGAARASPSDSFETYTVAASAAGRSIVLVDRPNGFPNAGCIFVRNDHVGRSFVRRIVSQALKPWFQEDNGAMAYTILRTAHHPFEIPSNNYSSSGLMYQEHMTEWGWPFPKRAHPIVHFVNDLDGPRPFCVRPPPKPSDFLNSEPIYHQGDWLVHGKHHDVVLIGDS